MIKIQGAYSTHGKIIYKQKSFGGKSLYCLTACV